MLMGRGWSGWVGRDEWQAVVSTRRGITDSSDQIAGSEMVRGVGSGEVPDRCSLLSDRL